MQNMQNSAQKLKIIKKKTLILSSQMNYAINSQLKLLKLKKN